MKWRIVVFGLCMGAITGRLIAREEYLYVLFVVIAFIVALTTMITGEW